MTVKELRAELEDLAPDVEVMVINDRRGSVFPVTRVAPRQIQLAECGDFYHLAVLQGNGRVDTGWKRAYVLLDGDGDGDEE